MSRELREQRPVSRDIVPASEFVGREDLKRELRTIITEDFFHESFTLSDLADQVGQYDQQSHDPFGQSFKLSDSDVQINLQRTLQQMVKEGFLVQHDDESYEVSEDYRMKHSS